MNEPINQEAIDRVNKAAQAITEFGHILAEAMKPLVDSFVEFGKSLEIIQEQKKRKYLARYHRRGERMKKHRK